MYPLYTLVKTYPMWALPLAFLFAQIGLFCRRKKAAAQYFFFLGAVGAVALAGLWIAFRGDLHSEEWVRSALGCRSGTVAPAGSPADPSARVPS